MKVIFFANTDWYLYNFRLELARYLCEQGAQVLMMSPPGEYGMRIEKQGFRWIPIPMERRSLHPLQELRLLRYIYAVYTEEQPDVVHNFTIKSVVYGALAAQAAGVTKRIHAVAGLGHVFISHSFQARLLRPLVKGLLRQALRGRRSRLILQNPDDRSLFLQHKLISTEQMYLIKGSGIDTKRFSPVARESQRKREKFRVVLAARLLWEKGIREYIEAATLLAHRASEVEFLLAGVADSGNPSAVPEQDIKRWQKSGLVTVLGHVENMPQLMTEIDLMVLPTYYGEGVPRSLLEAASMGLPIITTDAPGCREVVEHGKNGFLVPVHDAPALAAQIEYLLEHPDTCRCFGQAGRKKVCQEFAQEIVFGQTWDVYCSLKRQK